MEYAQLNPDGSYSHQITTYGNLEWDATHFCPASALTEEEAAAFGVVPLLEVAAPNFDPMTHSCQRNGGELVDGQWQYKWDVIALTEGQVQAAQQAAVGAIQASIVKTTQQRLDDFAGTRNYDGILSACTYVNSVIPKFAVEGQDALNARDLTWAALYAVLAEVQTGERPMPSGFADIESSLPVLTWSE